MNSKYYLSIKKNRNNVKPLYVNSLNNGVIPDKIREIDKFTSSYLNEEQLIDELVKTNNYDYNDLDGQLIIAKYNKNPDDNSLKYTKKYCEQMIFSDEKKILSNRNLYDIILSIIDNKEICNHIYNKFNKTHDEFFLRFISLFNNKIFISNIDICHDNLKELIMHLSYIQKRQLTLFIEQEIKNYNIKKQKVLELERVS